MDTDLCVERVVIDPVVNFNLFLLHSAESFDAAHLICILGLFARVGGLETVIERSVCGSVVGSRLELRAKIETRVKSQERLDCLIIGASLLLFRAFLLRN